MDHFNSAKNLDFKWLFTELNNGTLENTLSRKSIDEIADINTQVDFHRQQMLKKSADSPQLVERYQNITLALRDAASIIMKVIKNKGPKQGPVGEVF